MRSGLPHNGRYPPGGRRTPAPCCPHTSDADVHIDRAPVVARAASVSSHVPTPRAYVRLLAQGRLGCRQSGSVPVREREVRDRASRACGGLRLREQNCAMTNANDTPLCLPRATPSGRPGNRGTALGRATLTSDVLVRRTAGLPWSAVLRRGEHSHHKSTVTVILTSRRTVAASGGSMRDQEVGGDGVREIGMMGV